MRLGAIVLGMVLVGCGHAVQAQDALQTEASPPPIPAPLERPINLPRGPVKVPPAPPSNVPIPANNPGEWVGTADYPMQALREEREGTVAFTLSVNPGGRVSGCAVTQSSGSDALDTATCTLIQERAVFLPARDKKRNPIAGQWSSRVRWEIPKISPPISAGSLIVAFTVGENGVAQDCKVEEMTGKAAEEFVSGGSPCDDLPVFEPYRDEAGQPQSRRVRTTVITTVSPVD